MRSPRPPVAAEEMYAGLVRQVVETFLPYTEASPTAIASQFVIAFGNVVGRSPHFYLGETRHHCNEYLCVCGPTAIGRKGDAEKSALSVFRQVDPDWLENAGPGLSSGEGLISAVRDPVVKTKTEGKGAGTTQVVVDEGVLDKRFLATEGEFTSVLKQFTRDGNTLSNVLREAWDGRDVLRTRTKMSPLRATSAHISVIGHTTPEDLRRYLGDVEIANGTANRFMFAYVERGKLLPCPGRAPMEARERLAEDLQDALEVARRIGTVRFSASTEDAFAAIYPALSRRRPGLLGAILERGPAHVRRLAMIYALLDGRDVIEPAHLQSALAFWELVEVSASIIFAGRTGSDALDRILLDLLPGQTMSLEELRRETFSGHVSGGKMRDALALGVELGELELGERRGDGRPAVTVTRRMREATGEGAAAADSKVASEGAAAEAGGAP